MSEQDIASEVNQLLNEVIREINTPILDESCEICAPIIQAKTGMEKNKVLRELARLERAGKLTSHPAIYHGSRVKAFKKAK